MPFFKSSVTSRKFTLGLFTSIVILRQFLLKIVQSFFLIRSVCLAVTLETPRPSSLYRDDGLGVSKVTARQTDLIKKKLCTIFNKNCLRITIEVNKPRVNFLEVTLDLKNGTHRPFSKPGNIPLYVNSKSNHPPRILQNIPKSIN